MPFVPLGSRKRIEVVLDGDKELIQAKQAARDHAVIQRHMGAAPSQAGYLYANHPATKGAVRGPDVPFAGCHSSWRPPEADPAGPAGRHSHTVAKTGAVWEASHSFRANNLKQSRSSTTLAQAGTDLTQTMTECHPLTQELQRWKKMANHSIRHELNPNIEIPKNKPRCPTPERKVKNNGGLVNFPKYMLIHNCHLKSQDLQRYQKEQEAQRAAEEAAEAAEAAAAAEEAEATGVTEMPTPSAIGSQPPGNGFDQASWGAPLLRNAENPEEVWAGSSLPGGRAQRTSNPFRG